LKEERMMILTMLEEGKISSQEALKLLEALDDNDDEDFVSKDDKTDDKKVDIDKMGKVIKEQGKKIEQFGNDVSNKISNLFGGIKEKSPSINFLGNYETINTTLEKDISHIEKPNIDIKSINGNISLKPWDKESILVKVASSYKKGTMDKNDTFYDFYEEDNNIVFKPSYTNNIGIKLEVLVPNREYEKIILNTSNDKIEIEDINVDNLICDTTNASIAVSGLNGENVKLVTKNGRISLENINSPIIMANSTNSSVSLDKIKSEKIFVYTKNGRIYLRDVESHSIEGITSNASIEVKNPIGKNIKLVTSNGKIICDEFSAKDMEKLELTTSNASINTHFNEFNNILYFDFETSLGNINLEIPNLVYKVNQQNKLGTRKIIAHSIEYKEEEPHFKFIASTSNGSIKVN